MIGLGLGSPKVQMLTYDAIVVNISDLIGSSEHSFPTDQAANIQIQQLQEQQRRSLMINKEMNWNFKHCWVCSWANFIALLLPTKYAKYS